MIEKNEVLTQSSALGLSPDTIEKDYVLSWLLYGINYDSQIGKKWLFKGGTCLKTCYFETYRFSEDLDFSLSDQNHLNLDFLKSTFINISENIYETTGIEFFPDRFKFKVIPKENGRLSGQGRIHYNGPLRRKQGVATIKLDLTTDEIIILKGQKKRVHHPYTDDPATGIHALCYAFEEVIAEKVRALGQRARPRDLYDVIHFFRNRAMIDNVQLVYNILGKKCGYKKIGIPNFKAIQEHEKLEELESEWTNMLSHQLPMLPPLDSFWKDLEPFFNWLVGELEEQKLTSISVKDEIVFQAGRLANAYSTDSVLQRIQFAAANRICVSLKYSEKSRTVEPIAFRRSKAGNKLFYGFERDAGRAKAYSLNKIQGIEITNLPYTEKYPVEISHTGRISMPPITRSSNSSFQRKGNNISSKYVYRCPYCEKLFYRTKNSSKLNPHKDKNGYPCPGRTGTYL